MTYRFLVELESTNPDPVRVRRLIEREMMFAFGRSVTVTAVEPSPWRRGGGLYDGPLWSPTQPPAPEVAR